MVMKEKQSKILRTRLETIKNNILKHKKKKKNLHVNFGPIKITYSKELKADKLGKREVLDNTTLKKKKSCSFRIIINYSKFIRDTIDTVMINLEAFLKFFY
jgi:hypothetical protein